MKEIIRIQTDTLSRSVLQTVLLDTLFERESDMRRWDVKIELNYDEGLIEIHYSDDLPELVRKSLINDIFKHIQRMIKRLKAA